MTTIRRKRALTLPRVRRQHIEHRLADTKASKDALARFAISLRSLRLAQGFTLEAFAREVHCSHKTISNIENRQHWPSMAGYLAICRVLGQPQPPMT